MRLKDSGRQCRSFTLVEMLVVVSVIAILMALLLPVLRVARGKATQSVCMGSMKQLGVAISLYAVDHDNWMLQVQGSVEYIDIPYYRKFWIYDIHEYVDNRPFTKDHVSSVFRCPSGAEQEYVGNGNAGSYAYHARLGLADVGLGLVNPTYSPRRLDKCKEPSTCAIMIDGRNKAVSEPYARFDIAGLATALKYVDGRHAKGTNLLFADSHVAWDNPFVQSEDYIQKVYLLGDFWCSGWPP